MSGPPWKFEGFVSEAGGHLVQDWFWDELNDDERYAIIDRVGYLQALKRTLWNFPDFVWFGKQNYGEIRKSVSRGALRIYGTFDEERGVFIFLYGTIKKRNKDRDGMDLAEKRLKRLGNGSGTTHEFSFEERPTETNPAGTRG